MKIRRYTIALAFEDKDAALPVAPIIKDAIETALGEHIFAPVVDVCLEATRSVDVPDPDHRHEKHVEAWQDRAQEETLKTQKTGE
jgi:hypothetical protein